METLSQNINKELDQPKYTSERIFHQRFTI